MKVLLLTRYDTLGASSRIRSHQYLPYLRKHGINVTVAPLLGNSYIDRLYSNKPKQFSSILKAYLKRLQQLLRVNNYDVIWLEKEFFPWAPAVIPRLISYTEIPYIVDYDDAVFHRYDNHQNRVIRRLLGTKIDTVMANAEVVTVGNEYLAKRAKKVGATRIEYLPTVVDLSRYQVTPPRDNELFTVGWIGTPNTSRYIEVVRPALKKFNQQSSMKFVLVGSGKLDIEDVNVEVRSWSEETEVKDIQDFDVGIMPLYDGLTEKGKCGYKIIQYMACGRPVIASPVGINKQIVEQDNGFLAESTDEWVTSLSTLRDNHSLVRKMGLNGRKKIEEEYCINITGPKILSILNTIPS